MYTIWDIYHRSQQICQIGEGGHKSIECRGEIKPDIIIYESLGHSWYLQLSANETTCGMTVPVKKTDKMIELLDLSTFTIFRTKEPAKESERV